MQSQQIGDDNKSFTTTRTSVCLALVSQGGGAWQGLDVLGRKLNGLEGKLGTFLEADLVAQGAFGRRG
jgi:hypothetical protein